MRKINLKEKEPPPTKLIDKGDSASFKDYLVNKSFKKDLELISLSHKY